MSKHSAYFVARLRRAGGSYVVTIPMAIIEEMKLNDGDYLDVVIQTIPKKQITTDAVGQKQLIEVEA